MTSSWEFDVNEVAQNSIRHANHFLSYISNQNQKKSIQEISLTAQDAINGFKKLLTLLDGPMQPDCKGIRTGPLPNFHDIIPVHMMDTPIYMSQSSGFHSNQLHLVRQVMRFQNIQSSTVLIPTNGFNSYRENHKPAVKHCYSEIDLSGSMKLMTGLNHSSGQPNLSLISSDGNHVEKKIIRRSSSDFLSLQDESSVFSDSGMKSKEITMRSVASTGGCHCPKQRKLRKRKSIRVPALSDKLADIPPDDYSWRKYGQKPIKGSPHPRSYYRCSGMKDCPAKKLVERCLDDPTMLVVSYEGDHNHLRI